MSLYMSLHQAASMSNSDPEAPEKSSESHPAQRQGPSAGPDRRMAPGSSRPTTGDGNSSCIAGQGVGQLVAGAIDRQDSTEKPSGIEAITV
jgi:hypothetical protein